LQNATGLSKDVRARALNDGAVLMKDEEFDRWKIDRLVPGDSKERERWRRDGFRINEYGKPIFADKKSPQHALVKVQ
jgi:hypothetical protein